MKPDLWKCADRKSFNNKEASNVYTYTIQKNINNSIYLNRHDFH